MRCSALALHTPRLHRHSHTPSGADGRLGYGNTNDLTAPPDSYVPLGAAIAGRADKICAGRAHTCISTTEDPPRIYCWGVNSKVRVAVVCPRGVAR